MRGDPGESRTAKQIQRRIVETPNSPPICFQWFATESQRVRLARRANCLFIAMTDAPTINYDLDDPDPLIRAENRGSWREYRRTWRQRLANAASAEKLAGIESANPEGRPRKVSYADIRRVVNEHLAKGASLKRALSEANAELQFCDADAKPETLDKAWRRVLADKARGDNLTP